MADIQNLSHSPKQKEAVLKLMEEVYPSGAPQSEMANFETEFQTLLHSSNQRRILFIEEEGVPVATTAWRPFELKNGMKVACIGLVCTHKDHRKKGYSKELLAEAEELARKEKAVLICLWSDLVDFYFKMGYALCGSEITWNLADVSFERSPEIKVTELNSTQANMPAALYAKDPFGPVRSFEIFQNHFQQQNVASFFAAHPQKNSRAYCFSGKGRDLRNVIHEIVGDPELYPTLLAAQVEKLKSSVTEEYPIRLQFPYQHPYCEALEELLGEGEQGAVCFAKVLDLKTWVRFLNQELNRQGFNKLRIDLAPLQDNGIQPWILKDNEKDIFLSPDPVHTLQIFCHPWELESLEGLNQDVVSALQNWKAYPIYFWGIDSV